MTKEDKRQYCRDYYYKTRDERAHEYTLVSRRAYLRKRIKELGDMDPEKVSELQKEIDVITAELEPIRKARWDAKRADGKARFKHFEHESINEVPVAIN